MVLVLKLLLTPLLIGLATLAGRRWGPAFSGWFIGFPLTSGPVSIILALQQGPGFAAQAAVGNLGGLASISIFCLTYTLAARRGSPWTSLASAIGAYLLATLAWSRFTLALWPTLLIALAINAAAIRCMPRRGTTVPAAVPSRWDMPARMLVAMVFVFSLTTSASHLGPQLSGLITPFPVFGSVLAVFAHRQQGAGAAQHFLRGHAVSLFGFASFFLVVGAALTRLSMPSAYLFATLAAVAVNGLTLRFTGTPAGAP